LEGSKLHHGRAWKKQRGMANCGAKGTKGGGGRTTVVIRGDGALEGTKKAKGWTSESWTLGGKRNLVPGTEKKKIGDGGGRK